MSWTAMSFSLWRYSSQIFILQYDRSWKVKIVNILLRVFLNSSEKRLLYEQFYLESRFREFTMVGMKYRHYKRQVCTVVWQYIPWIPSWEGRGEDTPTSHTRGKIKIDNAAWYRLFRETKVKHIQSNLSFFSMLFKRNTYLYLSLENRIGIVVKV